MKKKPIIKLINTHQAKSELSKLIREVEEDGTLIRICRNGKPIVELKRVTEVGDPTIVDPLLSRITIKGDITEPVSEDDWPKESR